MRRGQAVSVDIGYSIFTAMAVAGFVLPPAGSARRRIHRSRAVAPVGSALVPAAVAAPTSSLPTQTQMLDPVAGVSSSTMKKTSSQFETSRPIGRFKRRHGVASLRC